MLLPPLVFWRTSRPSLMISIYPEKKKDYEDTVAAVKKALQHYAEKGGRTGIVRKAKAAATTQSQAQSQAQEGYGNYF